MGCGASAKVYTEVSEFDADAADSGVAHGQLRSTASTAQVGGPRDDAGTEARPQPPRLESKERSMDLTLESVSGPLERECSLESVGPASASGSPATWKYPLRVLLVRHAQSGKKESSNFLGGKASDPELSNIGSEQAQRLAAWLGEELREVAPQGVLVVTSPMRKCLLTILPAVRALELPRESCICHGGAYELGCAGTAIPGSSSRQIEEEFACRCTGFGPIGWGYQGDSPTETESDMVLRVRRLVAWLQDTAALELQAKEGVADRVLLLCMHETILDLIVRVLVDGDVAFNVNGEIKHKLKNSFITELLWSATGDVLIVKANRGDHLRFAVQPLIA
mmetsp:Transcript_119593/g.338502  ORF Transcript_119593/g.338502 Transcript_119593/m.338502 type:complete len:337 (+) Transcript_119593:84-1094(+)